MVVLVVVLGMVMVMVISGRGEFWSAPVVGLPRQGRPLGSSHALSPSVAWTNTVPGKRGEDDTLGKGCIEKDSVVQRIEREEDGNAHADTSRVAINPKRDVWNRWEWGLLFFFSLSSRLRCFALFIGSARAAPKAPDLHMCNPVTSSS